MNASSGLRTNLSIRWQFLPWGYRAQYDLEAPLDENSVKKAAEALVRSILPEECRSHDSVTDLRGRDPQQEPLLTDLDPPHPAREELFFISGEIAPEETRESEEEPVAETRFEAALHTKFKEFDGARHIVYSISKRSSGFDTDEPPNLLALTIDPAVTIATVRLGMDLFEPSSFVMIGLSPSATQSLRIECSSTRFALRITGEALPKRTSIPLHTRGIFERLGMVTQELFDFDLLQDYNAKSTR